MTGTSTCHLLNLPAEIRLHIYSYLVHTDPSHWTSTHRKLEFGDLMSCCKVIRNEPAPEVIKIAKKYRDDMTDRLWKDHGEQLRFTSPQTVYECFSFTVSRPKSLNTFYRRDHFLQVKFLYFNCLTVTFYDNEHEPNDQFVNQSLHIKIAWNTTRDIARWTKWDTVPCFRRLVFDWSNGPSESTGVSRMIFIRINRLLGQNEAWQMRERLDQTGRIAGVVFERDPMTTMWKRERSELRRQFKAHMLRQKLEREEEDRIERERREDRNAGEKVGEQI